MRSHDENRGVARWNRWRAWDRGFRRADNRRDRTQRPLIAGKQRTPIVKISTFAMRDRAEDAAAVHIEGGQREPVVTTIFGHETMSLRGFRRAHQLPTVGHRGGSRHFDRHMLSTTHRLDGHSGVVAPIGT